MTACHLLLKRPSGSWLLGTCESPVADLNVTGVVPTSCGRNEAFL